MTEPTIESAMAFLDAAIAEGRKSGDLDPEPWARFPDGPSGPRSADNDGGFLYWRPRPKHERESVLPLDPQPYADSSGVRWATPPEHGSRFAVRAGYDPDPGKYDPTSPDAERTEDA